MSDTMANLPDAVRDCQPVDDVTRVPWPDHHGCPYRPYGRFGYWLVFEEPHAKRGHARRRVFMTAKEARDGQLSKLEIDAHLLAGWFPPAAGADDRGLGFDARKVEAWLHYHAANAEVARLNRYEARLRAAGRWPQAAAPACAPAAAERPWHQPPSDRTIVLASGAGPRLDGRPEARTLHVRPLGDLGASVVVTVRPPVGDDYALIIRLSWDQRAALARFLEPA
jgi:hypothetical protein